MLSSYQIVSLVGISAIKYVPLNQALSSCEGGNKLETSHIKYNKNVGMIYFI